MKRQKLAIILFFFSTLLYSMPILAKVTKVKVVAAEDRARICPQVNCGQDKELIRVPTNTVLEVKGKKKIKNGFSSATWYKVSFKGKTGWISEYNVVKEK